MDPLESVKEARLGGVIPHKVYNVILDRFRIVLGGIDRIEEASSIHYPVAYVEPSVLVSTTQFGYGILFARTMPLMIKDKIRIVIQISGPLVAYGLKGTIHAVLAHEFLHYLELMHRIRHGMLSDEITGNLFESAYTDASRTLRPSAVFSDRTLIAHITKRFGLGFRDSRLENKTVQLWIKKGLPKIVTSPDTNMASIPAKAISEFDFPAELDEKLETMYKKSQTMRRRRKLY